MACNRFRNRGRESLRSSLWMSAKTKWIDICKTRSCTPWLDHALNGSIMHSMARSVDHALHCLIRHSVARSCTQWLDHALHGSIMHSMARSCTPWLDLAVTTRSRGTNRLRSREVFSDHAWQGAKGTKCRKNYK